MDLSVLVVAYNSAADLERCLSSLPARLDGLRWEICVVDNASQDGTADLVRHRFPEAILLASPVNRGFAAGVNLGLRATTGRYVLWLNPDAECIGGSAATLIQYLDAHPEVGVLGPRLVDPLGTIQLSCRAFPSYRTAIFHRYSILTRWFPGNPGSREYLLTDWDHGTAREVDWVSGACLLHARRVSDALNGLDERFFMYCEDVDFCLRARQAGWRVYFHPGLTVQHAIGGSSRREAARMVVVRHRSMWRYYAKHFRRHPFKDAMVGAGVWARCAWLVARARLVARRSTGNVGSL
jgi:GT2 family glycosyltransferase